jgi:Fe2+ or Zn2+ uptake regulation protein
MKMIFIIKEKMQNLNYQMEPWLTKLEESGFRVTAPRRAVIDILLNSNSLLEPVDIFMQARSLSPGLGLVTVYRTLEKLEHLNLIQRVHNQDGCHSYIAASNGHQHLLICTTCHKAEYFSGDDLASLMDTVGNQRGYKITEHWLQLSGLCSDCQKAYSKGNVNEK